MVARSAVAKHTNRGLTLVAAFVLVTLAPVARAQTQAPAAATAAVPAATQPPAFDVISVKPNKSSIGAHGLIVTEFTADGFRGVNVPVHTLLLEAYGLHEGESFGEPAWAGSEVFDIDAKVAGQDVVAFTKLDSDQRQAMLRQILAERFGLTVHRESRELPVYAMSVPKGGPKLKESAIDPAVAASARRGGGVQMSMGMIAAHECTIPYFLSMLSRQLGRTIIDRTGLTGNYDFTLRWSPDNGATAASNDPAGTQADSLPSIFSAVQEQLGLKLESTKAPADVLVVDHLERPSQN
jgi:uncharacterized protein (TIGR03435 family)